MSQNILYIAAPLFSEKLQKISPESEFPSIKKIGITIDVIEKREKELLGTLSPVKVTIVKAWKVPEARKIESMLHSILGNSRLDGEYFWDGDDSLLDSVTNFIETYHTDAVEIEIDNDKDTQAAISIELKKESKRLYDEVIPIIDSMGIKYTTPERGKSVGKGVKFNLGEYDLRIGCRSNNKYTLSILSKTKTTDEALNDFINSREPAAHGKESTNRKARIPMTDLKTIFDSLEQYKNKLD